MSVAYLFVGLLAAQSGMISNSTSPPPVIISVSPAPPPPMLAVRASPAEPVLSVPIHVRVAAGNQVLFDDTLRAAKNSAATFEQNRSEAPVGPCPANRGYGFGNRESLRVQVYLMDNGQSGSGARVTVNWQRPSTPDCGAEGSRTVAVSETVPLAPGQTATVRGDGDLVVTLSRR